MTTFVSQQVARPGALNTGALGRLLSAVREWGAGYAAAFRASAAAPRREGMDPVALLMFGRS